MSELALRVENLGKRYSLPNRSFWAFRNVSFELRRGEALGLIGRNGAGKSTLLKTLARITEPTEGYAGIKGRLAALLEVGSGFNFELTGRENIYLNGSMLGMRKREIDRKIAAIIDFAEVGDFIDVAVKHYSSGMYVRLAFAVAAHIEPDILLIDEVLGVGDIAFQRKCRAKIQSMRDEGRTMVIVSHDLAALSQLCENALLLDHGGVVADGPTREVIDQFNRRMADVDAGHALANGDSRPGSGDIRAVDFWIETGAGRKADAVSVGKDACFVLEYQTRDGLDVEGLRFSLQVQNIWGVNILWLHNDMMGYDFGPLAGRGQLRCVVPRFPLASGAYQLKAQLALRGGAVIADEINSLGDLRVVEGDFYRAGFVQSVERADFLSDARWGATNTTAEPDR